MTCRADKTALRNYVCVRVPSRFTLLALSSLLLSHGKMEHWLVYKNGAVKKKKDFELSRDIWRGMEIIRNFLFSFR